MKKNYERPKILIYEILTENCINTASIVFGDSPSLIQIDEETEEIRTEDWTFNP